MYMQPQNAGSAPRYPEEERHAPETGARAEKMPVRADAPVPAAEKWALPGLFSLSWGSEEVLLCALILWQLADEARDPLLLGLFAFLLLFG